MAETLNHIMETAFEDCFGNLLKDGKNNPYEGKAGSDGEALFNALAGAYRDITGEKGEVKAPVLFKWYQSQYDIGQSRKGNHRSVDPDTVKEDYAFDWVYKKDSLKYLTDEEASHPPATFIIHMAVAFKLKPTKLDELLQEYGYLPLHVRNLHHLTIYAVLNQYSPDDGRYDQFDTIKEWYFEAIEIMKADESEEKAGAVPESVKVFTADEQSDLTRMLRKEFREEINRQGSMEKDQFMAFVKAHRRQFRQRHSAILNEHRRLASVLGELNERRSNGYETAKVTYWDEAVTWEKSDCNSLCKRRKSAEEEYCENCKKACGNDIRKRKCGNFGKKGEIEEVLCRNCKKPTCQTEACAAYLARSKEICGRCEKGDCMACSGAISRECTACEKERTYNFECFVENFCNKEDQKHFEEDLMTRIHRKKTHHPTRESMILLWLFAEIYRSHAPMNYPPNYCKYVIDRIVGDSTNENDENKKNEMNEKIKEIKMYFGDQFDIAHYLFGKMAHPSEQRHLWDGAKVRDMINTNLSNYGWDKLNVKRSFDRMIGCFLQFDLDQAAGDQIQGRFRFRKESDGNSGINFIVDWNQKVPAPLWLLIEFARFGKDNLEKINYQEWKKYRGSKDRKIYPFLCDLYEQ